MKARQCKDVADLDVLRAIAGGEQENVLGAVLWSLRDELQLPPNLVRAKMESLVSRGLVDGCTCGCRGDFTLTEKGRAALVVA